MITLLESPGNSVLAGPAQNFSRSAANAQPSFHAFDSQTNPSLNASLTFYSQSGPGPFLLNELLSEIACCRENQALLHYFITVEPTGRHMVTTVGGSRTTRVPSESWCVGPTARVRRRYSLAVAVVSAVQAVVLITADISTPTPGML